MSPRRLTLALDSLPRLREATGSPDVDVAAAATLAELAGADAIRLGVGEELRPVRDVDVRQARRSARELELLLPYVLLAAARCVPLFWLTPALAFGVTPGLFGVGLALGLGCALCPLYAASLPLSAAALSGSALGLAAALELLRGSVIALGLSLPALVLRQSGAIAEGVFGLQAEAADSSKLGRLCGLAALAVAASADGLSGALRLLLSDAGALPVRLGYAGLRGLLRPLSQLLVDAFALGVRLSAALLLGSLFGALLLGILGRLESRAQPQGVGAALWPGFGLALLCLSAARWLDAVPGLLRGFAQSTARLLAGLP